MFLQKIRAGDFFFSKDHSVANSLFLNLKSIHPKLFFKEKKIEFFFFHILTLLSFFWGVFGCGFSPVFDRFLQTCCQLMLNPFWDAHYSRMQ